jgi:hypothetical protein
LIDGWIEAPYALKSQLIHGGPIVVFFLYYPAGGSTKLVQSNDNYTSVHGAISDKTFISVDVKHSVAPFVGETKKT